MAPHAAGDPIAGVIWITISMAPFAGLAVFSRQAMNAGLHPFEVVFLRNACAASGAAPHLPRALAAAVAARGPRNLALVGEALAEGSGCLVARSIEEVV